MVVADAVVIAVIGVMVIEGIWLAALTYLLWRRAKARKAEAPAAEPPKPE